MQAALSRSPDPALPLYEQDGLGELTGGTLRPGGIALTGELLGGSRLQPGASVLDAGCGPGHTLELMGSHFGLRTTGLDPSRAMLAKAARRAPAAFFLQGSATAIPCRDQCFDGIISECVLSLTNDHQSSLREMHRILRPGGMLILTDIYCKHQSPRPDLPGPPSCVSHALPLAEITDGLRQVGFQLLELKERSDLLKQLAGQIIFTWGSQEKFWQLFLGEEAGQRACCALAALPLGYYTALARKGVYHG